MTRRRALVTAAVTCLVLLAGSLAQAAQNPPEVIPEEALGFAVVNRLAETDAKIQRLAKELGLPVPSPLRMFQAGLIAFLFGGSNAASYPRRPITQRHAWRIRTLPNRSRPTSRADARRCSHIAPATPATAYALNLHA